MSRVEMENGPISRESQ